MKLWIDGTWYTLPYKLLIVYLDKKDIRNIKKMDQDCNLYCEYDKDTFDIKNIKQLLTKLKDEIMEM